MMKNIVTLCIICGLFFASVDQLFCAARLYHNLRPAETAAIAAERQAAHALAYAEVELENALRVRAELRSHVLMQVRKIAIIRHGRKQLRKNIKKIQSQPIQPRTQVEERLRRLCCRIERGIFAQLDRSEAKVRRFFVQLNRAEGHARELEQRRMNAQRAHELVMAHLLVIMPETVEQEL